MNAHVSPGDAPAGLYTAEERIRRDNSVWTLVQGILAPIQFLVFAISVGLIIHWWMTGAWLMAAHVSVVAKTLTLYAIMITGSIWEKDVFGAYLFARPFFWEDMVSMLVLALHTGYLVALWGGLLGDAQLIALAVAAYVSYVINAGQFLYKFRLARISAPSTKGSTEAMA
ncbi:2-vinyl bacteriochlorophyllide hydratase [Hoeflea sp. BAL378]|uniref:2-vinyl bacteriochlorophyllide hydratase n=1 Tax=Hoeflea sp. BAL378 TaxID=1547437 RepID=UPI000512FD89|nr:2-vinyl bacteriochlorophyllide hydratase [Hoeflea sp. BAL378]KGF67587.1 2-vinyl bacteriochlorophyllide hydratase [Hoeflea sp. BAL378]